MTQLPFLYTAQLIDRPDTEVAVISCSIWPGTQSVTESGVAYDHTGEAPIEHFAALREDNRVLRWNGADYVIVEATKHDFLPHVALRLRRTESARSG